MFIFLQNKTFTFKYTPVFVLYSSISSVNDVHLTVDALII